MTKFLADENIPRIAIEKARRAGVDIAWVKEIMPSASDEAILVYSVKQRRVLITFDRDFGELVFAKSKIGSCGIILLRIRAQSPSYVATFFVAILTQKMEWIGMFSVVTEDKIRTLPLIGKLLPEEN
jgi:predicted nuclease of predicted toxin-antitoxin system